MALPTTNRFLPIPAKGGTEFPAQSLILTVQEGSFIDGILFSMNFHGGMLNQGDHGSGVNRMDNTLSVMSPGPVAIIDATPSSGGTFFLLPKASSPLILH